MASMSMLEQLKEMTIVSADSGEVNKIKEFQPHDATTNPSLVNAAARLPEYAHLVDDAVAFAATSALVDADGGSGAVSNGGGSSGATEARMALLLDRLCVNFGVELSKHVPGFVSIEVDARLSFDTAGSLVRARRIVALCAERGLPRERVLVKLAATWEGIQAARVLELEGIKCNLTLLFCFAQAAAAAHAGATLISPFVGRILDWHRARDPTRDMDGPADPGVQSVARIYSYYKRHGVATIVMGASFRSVGEIVALAGCDRLTIAPPLLAALAGDCRLLPRALAPAQAAASCADAAKVVLSEPAFRFALAEDACANDKLAEGIRGFVGDVRKLEAFLAPLLQRALPQPQQPRQEA